MLRSFLSQLRPREDSPTSGTGRVQSHVVDYSAARAKAIQWLGDRYLLAKPINRTASQATR